MLDFLPKIKLLLQLEKIQIENTVFLLHYKLTAFILFLCAIAVTSKQYFGAPIECILSKDTAVPAINTYCLIFSTFTLVKEEEKGKHVTYPGLGNEHEVTQRIHQTYYQWIGFILIIQAIFFIVPHCLWSIWEGGQLHMLVSDLNKPLENWPQKKKSYILNYLTNRKLSNHNCYFLKFIFCEILNAINLVGQFYLLNKLFYGEYYTYGLDVIKPTNGTTPMDRIFPKISKCNFKHYGPTGSVQYIDALCILPMNILNEKIYLIFWYWVLILFVITVTGICFDLFLIVNPIFRTCALQARVRFMPKKAIRNIVKHNSIGAWFFLNQLGKNISPLLFGELLSDMANMKNKNNNPEITNL